MTHYPDAEGPEVQQGEPLELVCELEKSSGCSVKVKVVIDWRSDELFGLVVTRFSQCECVVMLYVCYYLTSEPPNLLLCLNRSKTVQKLIIIIILEHNM